MSDVIYTPAGRAREYSPLALNVYLGCSHGCKYCYAPKCRRQKPEEYFKIPEPRRNLAANLRSQLAKGRITQQVMLSFIGDCYCETADNGKAAREVLEILLEHGAPVAILSKGGERILRDLDSFKEFGRHIQVGETLTFDNDSDSRQWEPNAALPRERIEVMRKLHESGIRTFASFEPVIKPEQSLRLMRAVLPFCDVFKIGKINGFEDFDKHIDWSGFLAEAVGILRAAKKRFYVKHDLRVAASDVALFGQEVLADEYCVE